MPKLSTARKLIRALRFDTFRHAEPRLGAQRPCLLVMRSTLLCYSIWMN